MSPGNGGRRLEQAEGEDAADELADDADLAQKEEAGLPRHVDEGRVAGNGVDRRRHRGDEADDDIGGEQHDANPGAGIRLPVRRLHGRADADEVEAPEQRQAKTQLARRQAFEAPAGGVSVHPLGVHAATPGRLLDLGETAIGGRLFPAVGAGKRRFGMGFKLFHDSQRPGLRNRL